MKLFVHLRKTKVERDLCLQLLRSGTSVGANVEESVGGSSRKDFAHKIRDSIQRGEGNKVLVKTFERK